MIKVLIIEDDKSQRDALNEYLSEIMKLKTLSAENVEEGFSLFEKENPDIVLSDLMMPDGTGIDIVKKIRILNSEIPFIILTAQPTIETAVEAVHSGASDYLTKPVDFTLLKKKILSFTENINLKLENKILRERISGLYGQQNLAGNSAKYLEVLKKTKQIASADVTVLLEGESGTGKELIANLIHENSSRAKKPFIKVNCGALTKSILESELFGTVKGAYTGADRDRAGYFEAANGGTIFLDEIGELELESQVRLLRVLEERKVIRLGSTVPIDIDVRIIAATNKNLMDEVDEEKFREDLYYRLAVIRIFLPPLRERKDDIPLLFNHFVVQFNEKYGKSVTGLSPDLLKYFQNYNWPGNIREFRNVLEGMVVLAEDDILEKSNLPPDMQQTVRKGGQKLLDSVITGISMDEYEKAIIEKNLYLNDGNREKTAEILKISERTLYRKIKEFDL